MSMLTTVRESFTKLAYRSDDGALEHAVERRIHRREGSRMSSQYSALLCGARDSRLRSPFRSRPSRASEKLVHAHI
jgi:hypothetical protein